MPCVYLTTSVSLAKDFEVNFVKFLAQLLNKPAAGIFTSVTDNTRTTVGGTPGPTALLQVGAIGVINPTSTAQYTAAISEHLKETIGVPKERVFIHFVDFDPNLVGKNGTSIAQLLAAAAAASK